jgi:hypothetical protein
MCQKGYPDQKRYLSKLSPREFTGENSICNLIEARVFEL